MINATRSNWLLKLEALRADPSSQETVQVYPLDGLTRDQVADAMRVQGMIPTFDRYGAVLRWGYPDDRSREMGRPQPVAFSPNYWIIAQHGNVIYIRRANS